MNALVQRLAHGEHPIMASRYDTAAKFKQSIDWGYVLLRFTDTQGGTELGFRPNQEATELNQGDFEKGTGTIRLVGNLTLNYVPVVCVADLDLATLHGTGRLEILGEPRPKDQSVVS